MKPKKNPDATYKTCIYCGTEWNVSKFDKPKYNESKESQNEQNPHHPGDADRDVHLLCG